MSYTLLISISIETTKRATGKGKYFFFSMDLEKKKKKNGFAFMTLKKMYDFFFFLKVKVTADLDALHVKLLAKCFNYFSPVSFHVCTVVVDQIHLLVGWQCSIIYIYEFFFVFFWFNFIVICWYLTKCIVGNKMSSYNAISHTI